MLFIARGEHPRILVSILYHWYYFIVGTSNRTMLGHVGIGLDSGNVKSVAPSDMYCFLELRLL